MTLTTIGPPIIRFGIWNFSNVQKLRLTSQRTSADFQIFDRFPVPKLTHLALPLHRDTTQTARRLLGSPRMKKLAVFAWYGPGSTVVRKRITNVSSRNYNPDCLGSLEELWADSEGLGSIVDDRLLLFDYVEMESEVSNEAFWDAIERL